MPVGPTLNDLYDTLAELSEHGESLPELIDAINNAAAAIRDQTSAFRELIDKADAEVANSIPFEPEPRKPFGVGIPPADADRSEWNRAAIQYAIQSAKAVTFNYRKVETRWWLDQPYGIGGGNMTGARERLVRPYRYEATGSADNTAVVRAYDLEDSEMSKTFRLDRIDGFVIVKDDVLS